MLGYGKFGKSFVTLVSSLTRMPGNKGTVGKETGPQSQDYTTLAVAGRYDGRIVTELRSSQQFTVQKIDSDAT
jgi:hypothetical protein